MQKIIIQFLIFGIVFLFCAGCASTRYVPSEAGLELQRELDAVRIELAVATERVQQLDRNNERAITIIQRSEQRFNEFEISMAELDQSSIDIFDRIEERNRRIKKLVDELWRDNQELRAELRNSN